jgi:hypothetical protein
MPRHGGALGVLPRCPAARTRVSPPWHLPRRRQNTLNDLQLIVGLSTSLLLLGSWARHKLLAARVAAAAAATAVGGGSGSGEAAAGSGGGLPAAALDWWQDAYTVMLNSFGENFPASGGRAEGVGGGVFRT